MPSFLTITTTATTRMQAAKAAAETLSTGSPMEFAEVLRVEDGVGVTPGKAFLCVRNSLARRQIANQIVMNPNGELSEKGLQYWSRIRIMSRGECLFVGSLQKRKESVQGQALVLEYWDDRWLLQKIALRGALVYDKVSSTVKWLTGYDPRTNPLGMKNCTEVSINGFQGSCYVFTELAEQGTDGKSPYLKVGNEPIRSAGVALDWTPERFMIYQRAMVMISNAVSLETQGQALLDQTKLEWPTLTFSGSGNDDQTGNLITHKMPDINFVGETVLTSLQKTLDVTGEYDLAVQYDKSGKCILKVECKTSDAALKRTLFVQQSGVAEDIKTIFDGAVEGDSTELATDVVYDGQTPAVEGRIQFTQADNVAGVGAVGSDHFFPAWTGGEEYFFLCILWRGEDANGNRIKNSDGTNLTTHSVAALHLARNTYPKVFRAFACRGGNIDTLLNGVNSKFGLYPRLTSYKVLMPTQLQPYFETNTAGKVSRGRIRLDIRIELTNKKASDSTGKYEDAFFNNGLRVTDDGLIWFDGLTDDNPAGTLYTGTLRNPAMTDPSNISQTGYPHLRKIRLNAAIRHDTRVMGRASVGTNYDPHKVSAVVDPSVIKKAKTGKDILQKYVLSDGFREEHQKTSFPCLPAAFQVTTSDGTGLEALAIPATGINKVLHQDDTEIRDAAKRKLKEVGRIVRGFRFDLPGIRFDVHAGLWLEKIETKPDNKQYLINAPIARVVRDFESQKTSIFGERGA